MQAGVVEGLDGVGVGADDEDRLIADQVFEERPDLGDFLFPAGHLPDAGPQAIELQVGELGAGVAGTRDRVVLADQELVQIAVGHRNITPPHGVESSIAMVGRTPHECVLAAGRQEACLGMLRPMSEEAQRTLLLRWPKCRSRLRTRRLCCAGTATDPRYADRPALRFGDRIWTHAELLAEAERFAALFRARLDPDRPPHVGLLLDNTPDYVFALCGAGLAGWPWPG